MKVSRLKNQEIAPNSNQKYLVCDTCYDKKLKLLNYCGYNPPNGTVEYRIIIKKNINQF